MKKPKKGIQNRIVQLDRTEIYFRTDSPYKGCAKEDAEKLTRPAAESVRRNLRKLGYTEAKIIVLGVIS